MNRDSFGKVSYIYDFFEKNIIKDYQGSIEIIKENMRFKNSDLVIDVGGGTGYITDYFTSEIKSGVVLDFSRNMLSKNKNLKILKVVADGTKLPLKTDISNVAIVNSLLHHVSYKKQIMVLKECYRILSQNGTLFIVESAAIQKFSAKLFRILERAFVGKTYFITPESLSSNLKTIGFKKIEKIFPEKHDWKYAIKAIK
jgi:demethylmenaquinone methyltransferase/2-methoxy-6-polyprenyl-1,4-benzoquinol methylase